MNIFLQGLIMGLAYLAPIGVQNLFIINTALTQNKNRVFLTALTVIFFDITLAFACFFGIGALMEKSKILNLIILLIGSLVLIYIGIGLLKAKAAMKGMDVDIPFTKVITSACVVTWFNPQALIDGSMMLGAFRVTLSKIQATQFITGVASASILWFLGLSFFILFFSSKFSDKVLRRINIICGVIVMFYGFNLFYKFAKISFFNN